MATSVLQPPPTMGGPDTGQGTPTPDATPSKPPISSPAPAKPSPGLQRDTEKAIEFVHWVRGIASSYPAAAPHVAKINDEIRNIMRIVMEHQEVGEPAAPPITG